MITRLEVRRLGSNEIVHVIPLDPPLDPDSNRLEKIMRGLLTNMSDDCYVSEVEGTA